MQLDRHLDRCPACGFELCKTAKQLNKEMEAVEDRLRIIRQAMERIFHGRPSFQALWTYINAEAEG